MPKLFHFLLIAVPVLLARPAFAADQWQIDTEKSKIDFIIHSALHEVDGSANDFSGGFDLKADSAKGFIDIDVAGLRTGNDQRDKNMFQMFDVNKYKNIHFDFDCADINKILTSSDVSATFSGSLMIHNITRPVTIVSQAHKVGENIVCTGGFVIHLKDYSLKPPGILGAMMVHDQVDVSYSIVFKEKGKDNDPT